MPRTALYELNLKIKTTYSMCFLQKAQAGKGWFRRSSHVRSPAFLGLRLGWGFFRQRLANNSREQAPSLGMLRYTVQTTVWILFDLRCRKKQL